MPEQMPKRRNLSQQKRREVYDKLEGHCAYCGCEISIKQMQADHLVPLALGGADEVSNLLPSCRSCNHRKSTERLELFRHSVEHFEGVLARDNVTYRNAVRFGQVTPTPHPVVFYFENHLRDTTKKVIEQP